MDTIKRGKSTALTSEIRTQPLPELRYIIEHGVEIPKGQAEMAAMLKQLEVGDSVLIESWGKYGKSRYYVLYAVSKLLGIKVKMRNRRIWRIA